MVNLKKGNSISLDKAAGTPGTGLVKATVGLGWEVKDKPFDLDVSCFVCRNNAAGEPKLLSESHFVFFNNKTSPDGAVVHSGDNRTGVGEGDDESIVIDFSKLPSDASEISFIVTIYEAQQRQQTFNGLGNAYIRVYDGAGTQIVNYDLDATFSTETSCQFGSLVKNASGMWEFKAVGAGYTLELGDFLEGYTA